MRIARALFYILLVAIPLSSRLFLASVIPGVHEYESLFVYLSDVLMLIYLLAVIFHSHQRSQDIHQKSFKLLFIPLYIFIFSALISTYIAPSYTLALYDLVRLLLLIGCAVSIPIMMRTSGVFRKTMVILALLAVAQSCLGVYQFTKQADAGLRLLGEPRLVSYTGSASTIMAEGGRVLRSYGTFPHPNILGAFLIIGLISLCCLFLSHDGFLYHWNESRPLSWNFKRFMTSRHFFARIIIAIGLFVVLLGLATTLSRGAWVGAACALITLLLVAAVRGYFRPSLRLLVVLAACGGLILYILNPVISPRSYLAVGQPAVDYRLVYTSMASSILHTHPFGVGIGNQVLYAVDSGTYRSFGLVHLWEWEPIHNLYLLILSEIGVLGLLSFIAFLGIVVWHALRHSGSLAEITVLAILIGILAVGLFDHYLWTIEPGRLMLWLAIGLALSYFKTEKSV